MQLPNRQSIRLTDYDYTSKGAYFVTICTQDRKYLFGNIVNGKMVLNDAGKMIENIFSEIPKQFPNTILGKNILMPNHFHAIVQITVGAESISARNNDIPADMVSAKTRADVVSAKTRADVVSAKTRADVVSAKTRADMESAPTGKISLSEIIQTFKRYSTIEYIKMVNQNLLPSFDKRIWQRNYWEHIIRNNNEYNRIADYIENNPGKWDDDQLNTDNGYIITEQQSLYGHEEWMV